MLKNILRFLKKTNITSSSIIKKLRKGGALIGKGVHIYNPTTVVIDDTRPFLLSIGEYTIITSGVTILTHDYSLSTLRRVYGQWIGEGRKTTIGNNCFIGINSIILMGSHIGNNVIVGAGSVVRGTIPDNCVVSGNPARVIMSLDEHYKNRMQKTLDECIETGKAFYERKGTLPTPKDLSNFKFLFAPRDEQYLKDNELSFVCNGDESSEVRAAFFSSYPLITFEEITKRIMEKE